MIRLDTVGLNYVKHISKIFIYSFMYLSKIYNRRSILQMTIYSSIFLSIYQCLSPYIFLTCLYMYMYHHVQINKQFNVYINIYVSIYLSIRSHPLFTATNVFRIPFIQYLSERYMYEICKCIRNIFDINICSLYISLH